MIDFHNETFRFIFICFLYVFFISFVIIYTRKNKTIKLQILNIRTQMKLAILLYLIFSALNCVVYYWLKVNPNLMKDRFIWIQIVSFILTCAGLILTLKNGEKISKIGFNFNYFYINFGILIPLGAMFFIPGGIETFQRMFAAFPKFFLFAIIEEAFFRAYLQSRCESYFGMVLGLLVVSLLFAVMHVQHLFTGDIFVIFTHFLSALSFGILFIRTRSLVPGLLLHAFGNSIG